MAVTVINLASGLAPSTVAAVFTTSGAIDVIRGAVAFANTAAVLSLYKVPSTLTASVSNQIGAFSLSASETRVLIELFNQVFTSGDSLWVGSSVTGAIAINIGGSRIA